MQSSSTRLIRSDNSYQKSQRDIRQKEENQNVLWHNLEANQEVYLKPHAEQNQILNLPE
jgi:hypothetical protein